MPNWASTAYLFKAKNQEQAKDLYEKIDSLSKVTEPLVPNGFGKLWMGCLVNLLGGDWDKVYCRGEIIDYNLNGDIVSISCETAWGAEGEYFKDRYCLDSYDGLEYFETIEEAAEYIGERIGKELLLDFAKIESAIDDYMEEHDNSDESWMSFHRFDVLND